MSKKLMILSVMANAPFLGRPNRAVMCALLGASCRQWIQRALSIRWKDSSSGTPSRLRGTPVNIVTVLGLGMRSRFESRRSGREPGQKRFHRSDRIALNAAIVRKW